MQNISVLSVESAAIMQYNRNIGQSNYKESDEMEPNHDSVNGLDFEKTAVKVSVVSVVGNIALSLLKLLVGIFAHSGALISDAVHSASDVFSSIIVIIGVKLSARESDDDHPYGHERLECVAAIVLAMVLLLTGMFIGYKAIRNIVFAFVIIMLIFVYHVCIRVNVVDHLQLLY